MMFWVCFFCFESHSLFASLNDWHFTQPIKMSHIELSQNTQPMESREGGIHELANVRSLVGRRSRFWKPLRCAYQLSTFFAYSTHNYFSKIGLYAIMVSVAKKRKMNFSEREVEIIVEEIEKQKHTLVNHFNAGVTHMAKNNAWLEILKKVNAVTTCPRELPEVKKKWSDMKTEVRRKVAQARAAIEGTSTDCTPVPVLLTVMQQRICNLLGEATIISLPAGDSDTEITLPVTANATTTVTLTESKMTNVCLHKGRLQPYFLCSKYTAHKV